MAAETKTAEIVVQFFNPIKPGKKNASVKTTDNEFYLVPPELIPQVNVGGKYKIEYETFKGRDGTLLSTIKKVDAAGPSPVAHYQAKKNLSTDVTAEVIFCQGIHQRVVAALASPLNLTEDDHVEHLSKLRRVWRRTFGNPQQDKDMDDEVPY